MEMIKKLGHNLVDLLGFRLYNQEKFPAGMDVAFDINRFFPAEERLVFDVGANIGDTALYFAENFKNSTIHSFEIITSTFETLRRNTARNSRIFTYNFGFGDKEEQVPVYVKENSALNSVVATNNIPSAESVPSEVVRLRTMDSFAEEQKIKFIDVLKIDTEGFDLNVLKGASGLLGNNKIGLIYVEVGFIHDDTVHSSFYEISKFLEGFGYRLFAFYDQIVNMQAKQINFCNALFAGRIYPNKI